MSGLEQGPQVPADAALPRGPAGGFILLLAAVMPFLMLAITYEVVARYFFGATPLWVNDVTGYLLLALTFLGGAFVMARDGHTRVDIVYAHSGPRVQRWLALVNAALILLVAIVLTGAAGFTVWDAYQRKLAVVGIIDVPRYVVVGPIFAGGLLLCIERVRRIRALVRTFAARTPST